MTSQEKLLLFRALVQRLRTLDDRDESLSKLTIWAERVSRTTHMKVFDETVYSRYYGLVETFDVLGRSDLSENLVLRTDQLIRYIKDQRDMPTLDLMAMLLELSRDPVHSERYTELLSLSTKNENRLLAQSLPGQSLPCQGLTQTTTWKEYLEIIGEPEDETGSALYDADNCDLSDWSDLSSLSDASDSVSDIVSSLANGTGPTHTAPKDSGLLSPPEVPQTASIDYEKEALIRSLRRGAYWNSGGGITLSEADVLRECLLVLFGHPSVIFDEGLLDSDDSHSPSYGLRSEVKVAHLSTEKLTAILDEFHKHAKFLRTFRNLKQPTYVSRVCPSFSYAFVFGLMDSMLKEIQLKLLSLENGLLNDLDEPLSLVQSLNKVENILRPYQQVVSVFVKTISRKESEKTKTTTIGAVQLLNNLFARIPVCEISGDHESYQRLTDLFGKVFEDYMCNCGVNDWLNGAAFPRQEYRDSFLLYINEHCQPDSLWYELAKPNLRYTPVFLKPFIETIAETGKIAYFLRATSGIDPEVDLTFSPATDPTFTSRIDPFTVSTAHDAPIMGTFNDRFVYLFENWLQTIYDKKNKAIYSMIERVVPKALQSIQDIYFMINSTLMIDFMSRIMTTDPTLLTRAVVDTEFQAACKDFDCKGFCVSLVDLKSFNIVIDFSPDSALLSNIFTQEIIVKCQRILNLLFRCELLWRDAINKEDSHKHEHEREHVIFINQLMTYIYQTVLKGSKSPVLSPQLSLRVITENHQAYINRLHHLCFLDTQNNDNKDLLSILQARLQDIMEFVTSYESAETSVQIFKQLVVSKSYEEPSQNK